MYILSRLAGIGATLLFIAAIAWVANLPMIEAAVWYLVGWVAMADGRIIHEHAKARP